jgi:hypothetical protein
MFSDSTSNSTLRSHSSPFFSDEKSGTSKMECKAAAPCCCPHTNSHFLVRCGCPNDKPPSHPMHVMDDAFHREWCTICLRFCYQPPDCTYVRRTSHRTLRNPLAYIGAVFDFLTREWRCFLQVPRTYRSFLLQV